mgnify:CR=1 FL=1
MKIQVGFIIGLLLALTSGLAHGAPTDAQIDAAIQAYWELVEARKKYFSCPKKIEPFESQAGRAWGDIGCFSESQFVRTVGVDRIDAGKPRICPPRPRSVTTRSCIAPLPPCLDECTPDRCPIPSGPSAGPGGGILPKISGACRVAMCKLRGLFKYVRMGATVFVYLSYLPTEEDLRWIRSGCNTEGYDQLLIVGPGGITFRIDPDGPI